MLSHPSFFADCRFEGGTPALFLPQAHNPHPNGPQSPTDGSAALLRPLTPAVRWLDFLHSGWTASLGLHKHITCSAIARGLEASRPRLALIQNIADIASRCMNEGERIGWTGRSFSLVHFSALAASGVAPHSCFRLFAEIYVSLRCVAGATLLPAQRLHPRRALGDKSF
jgi:hypothetical protein